MAKVDVFRAVRRYCLTCQGESAAAVRGCADQACPLWPWRLLARPSVDTSAGPDVRPEMRPDALPHGASAAAATGQGADTAAPHPQAAPAASVGAGADRAVAAAGRAQAVAPEARVPFAPSAARTALRHRLLRVIRRQCLACAGHRKDVRQCGGRDCELWALRFGVMPETYRAVRARFFGPKPLSLF